jgi:hypothetical protein
MITDEQLRKKIKRHHKRKSRNAVRYFANSFGKDMIIWKSLCALHVQERTEKDMKRYINIRDMIWLIAIKQFLVEHGADSFYMREIRRFMNYNFKQNKSALTSQMVLKTLLKSGHVMREGLAGNKLVLTMKARAFYRDLDDLLSI